jgi:adenylyltransferase/sulfurtransferase
MLQQDSPTGGEQAARRLTSEASERYSRQLVLPGFGAAAQLSLAEARVLVIGGGGLGSAIVPALAATGVGTIGVVDADSVELSNLHRQTSHGMADIGRLKVDSLADTVAAIDPAIRFRGHSETFSADNAEELLREYDLLIDGSDNFATRYLASDAAVLASMPLVWGAVLRYDGQVGVSWPAGPTYRDLFPMPPDAADVLDCSIGGVLPSVCAVIGGLVVAETVKLITGIGEPLIGRMLAYDARSARVREVEFRASPDAPPVASLTDHTGRGPGAQSRVPSAGTDDVATVTAQALLADLGGANPPVLVDVRTPEEREQRPLTEAADTLEVPMTELEPRSERLREHAAALSGLQAEGADVVIVCSAGVRSARAVLALAAAGVTGVRSLRGGTLALDAAAASARRGRSSSSTGVVTA